MNQKEPFEEENQEYSSLIFAPFEWAQTEAVFKQIINKDMDIPKWG